MGTKERNLFYKGGTEQLCQKVQRSNKVRNKKYPVSQVAQSHLPPLSEVPVEKGRKLDCIGLRSG